MTSIIKKQSSIYQAIFLSCPILIFLAFSNSVQAGCLSEDCTNGFGTYTWASGSKYVGDFVDGARTGQGTFTEAAYGSVYVGGWVNNVRTGQGTLTWANGDKYVGDWVNDAQTRQGTYTWANGDKYVGDWVNGARTGQGTLTFADGTKQIGTWENSIYIGAPPTANFTFSPTSGKAPLEITFTSTSSDSDGSIVGYEWSIDGQFFSVFNPIDYTFLEGQHTISLTVTDNDGLTHSTQQTIIVDSPPPKIPPTANFTLSPTNGQAPLPVTFDASSSNDSDGTITKYDWFLNGTLFASVSSNEPVSYIFPQGEHTIGLTVTDNDGATDTAQKIVTVTEIPNESPNAILTITPNDGIGQTPLIVNLNASQSSDSDGDITSWHWTSSTGQTASGQTSSFTFTPIGTHTVTLTVTDDDGATATAQKTITVTEIPVVEIPNTPPTAAFSASPKNGIAPLIVNLNASQSSDSDGNITNYRWTSSNGQTISGENASFTFESQGDYDISLVVEDNEGFSSTNLAQEIINVSARPVDIGFDGLNDSYTIGEPLAIKIIETSTDATRSDKVDLWVSIEMPNSSTLFITPSLSFSTNSVAFKTGISPADTTHTAFEVNTLPTGFEGTYVVHAFYVEEGENPATQFMSSIEQTVLIDKAIPLWSSLGQAVIIAAGGAQPNNTLFEYSNDFTQRMYRLLKERGFTDSDVHYMNPHAPDIDMNGYPDDGQSDDNRRDFSLFDPEKELAEAFSQATANLSAGQQFIFYLHGHARQDHFLITPSYELPASKFSDLLATLPAGIQQVIILDSCYSGSFIDELAGVDNRIIITSSDDSTSTWNTEYNSFADTFLRSLRRGKNLHQAFLDADDMIFGNPKLFRQQKPWLDDDNDGQYSSRDGTRAATVYLGEEGIQAAPPPTINQVHPRITLAENEASTTLWLNSDTAQDNIRTVRAVLVNPELADNDYNGLDTDFGRIELEMLYSPVQDRYGVVYDNFCTAGNWQILYQIQNTSGVWSDIVQGEVQAQGCSSSATVDMLLNQSSYSTDELLRLDMEVNGNAIVDLYAAILFPDGYFITITHPLNFSWPNAAQVYQANVEISGQKTYPIMNLPIPIGIALGQYSACGVLVEQGTAPLDQSNWLDIHCADFEVY